MAPNWEHLVANLTRTKPSRRKLMVTLWPSFPHFRAFANDPRLHGIRLNSAMISQFELETELAIIRMTQPKVPLYFDVKARQLRIAEVLTSQELPEDGSPAEPLQLRLNHPINVVTPCWVEFKGGEDFAKLIALKDSGQVLVFEKGPRYTVRDGESLCVRHASLEVKGPQFSDAELAKIAAVKDFGFDNYFLSYVESQRDVDEFRDIVGRHCEVMLKIENNRGLAYVASEFNKEDGLILVAACGDLFVEVDQPQQILPALRLIIERDPEAVAASRLLLSVSQPQNHQLTTMYEAFKRNNYEERVARNILRALLTAQAPSLADYAQLAWLYDLGYSMMLCDEICLHENLLTNAVDEFERFREAYTKG